MSKEIKTLFLVNTKTASPADRNRIENLSNQINNSVVWELRPEFTIPPSADTVVACGGDGTVLSVFQHMDSNQLLLIYPVGSHDGTAYGLRKNKETAISFNELREGMAERKIPLLPPGSINGEIFLHATGWDTLSVEQARITEELRGRLPLFLQTQKQCKFLRGYVGSIAAALRYSHTFSDEYVVSLAFLGPSMARHTIYPAQKLASQDILLARVKGGRGAMVRLSNVFFDLLLDRPITEGLVQFTQEKEFSIPATNPVTEVNVDGEVKRPTIQTSSVTIERLSKRAIRTAVLYEHS